MRSIFFPLAALAVLAGCATRPSYDPNLDASNRCLNELRATPAAAILSSRAILNGNEQPSVEMLSDASYPTDAEKRAISTYNSFRVRCRELGDGYRSTVIPPVIRTRQDNVFAQTTVMMSKLYAGQMTWGEYNAERGRVTREAQQDIVEVATRMQAAEQAERRRAAAAFSNSLAQQQQIQLQQQQLNQQIYQQNRPVQTNCSRFGNQTSCTTY